MIFIGSRFDIFLYEPGGSYGLCDGRLFEETCIRKGAGTFVRFPELDDAPRPRPIGRTLPSGRKRKSTRLGRTTEC